MKRTALVVDDCSGQRSIERFALEEAGFLVVEAGSGEEALGIRGYSVAVLDMDLGEGMNGAELALELRKLDPELPIVFASGNPDLEEITRGIGGRVSLIAKPFSFEELVAAVSAYF